LRGAEEKKLVFNRKQQNSSKFAQFCKYSALTLHIIYIEQTRQNVF